MDDTYHPPLSLRWNSLACDAIYYTKTPPTRAARVLAMVHTAMYDAWSAYTEGDYASTTTFRRLRQPREEWTPKNREIAFSFAAYGVLEELFGHGLPAEHKLMFSSELRNLGCAVDDQEPGLCSPQGIGLLCAKLVLESRLGDGSNQGGKYGDYTGYKPVNDPPPAKPLNYVEKWQPQVDGNSRIQEFLTPHWGLVRPFAMEWGGQFRPAAPISAYDCQPPAKDAPYSAKFIQQARKVIKASEDLTDQQKLTAEYWAGMHEDKVADGKCIPNHGCYATPAIMCCRMARQFAKKNKFANMRVIKMFFALSNALLDATIAVWDAKQYYDYARPVSVIREVFDETKFKAWGGPCRGTLQMEGEGWQPYLKYTPRSAEYPSVNSALFRATADIVQHFWSGCEYGEEVTFRKHSSVIEPGHTPSEDIVLSWPTLHDAAEEAGRSLLYAGTHFEAGIACGREIGRQTAACAWRKACRYFDGLPD